VKILLVEDDTIAQMVYQHYLKKLNCAVDLAESGYQAIAAITGPSMHDYDAMILDIGLPDIGGEFVVSTIRCHEKEKGRNPALPIIVTTAHSNETVLHECHRRGATQALYKPISCEQLRKLLSAFINHNIC
jgi:CheY-like chemotaxis protein